MHFCWTILVALVAITVGIVTTTHSWLPHLIDKLVALETSSSNSNSNLSLSLQRLQIGHAMAGGGSAGSQAMADALQTALLSKLVGVKSTLSRQAWRRFLHVLRDAEQRYLSPSWGFGFVLGLDNSGGGDNDNHNVAASAAAANEIAEGLRYVSHVIKLALDVYLEDAPRFVRFVSPTLKLLGDNPDAIYHLASLQSHDGSGGDAVDKEFLVTGCRAEHEVYFSVSVHAPSLLDNNNNNNRHAMERVVTDINDESIEYDSNGCFKLYLSPTHPGSKVLLRNGGAITWLETPKEATSLVTRHYFDSWPPAALHETVQISIQTVSSAATATATAPTPVTDAVVAHRIDLASDFIRRHTTGMPQPDPTTTPPFFALLPNQIGVPQKWKKDTEGMGAVDIAYAAGRFLLKDDQALILQGVVPKCRFANVVLWNRFLQTLDYTAYDEYPVFLTLKTPSSETNTDDDSTTPFAIVLSKTRPTTTTTDSSTSLAAAVASSSLPYQWMYTEGRSTGTIFFRFLLPEAKEGGDDQHCCQYQRINTTVLPLDQVTDYFSRIQHDSIN